jgi:hypothetical protein
MKPSAKVLAPPTDSFLRQCSSCKPGGASKYLQMRPDPAQSLTHG